MQSFKPSMFSFPKMTGKMGLFIYWGKYSFIHSCTHSLTHSFINSFTCLFIYLFIGTKPCEGKWDGTERCLGDSSDYSADPISVKEKKKEGNFGLWCSPKRVSARLRGRPWAKVTHQRKTVSHRIELILDPSGSLWEVWSLYKGDGEFRMHYPRPSIS